MDCFSIGSIDQIQLSSREVEIKGLHEKMKILTYKGIEVLHEENFRSSDFWEGYKLYCFAHYSQCRRSKARFLASKMGRVVYEIQNEKDVWWGLIFDQVVREVWAMMEEYGDLCYGENWKNLRSLIKEFDNVKKLSMSENGCLLLQLVEDDKNGSEELHWKSRRLKIKGTNIFDELQGRLSLVGSNLNRLIKSSGMLPNVNMKRRRNCPSAGHEVPNKFPKTE